MTDEPRRGRHRRKTIEELALEKAAVRAGAPMPDDWQPDRDSQMYEARLRAWKVGCPKCGAPAYSSCKGAREGTVRWAFHRARWAKPKADKQAR